MMNPTAYSRGLWQHDTGRRLRVLCVCLCLCVIVCTWPRRYACYLYFQLRTHHDMFCGDDEDEEPVMTFPGALAVLTGITVAVAVCSE